MIFLGHDSMIFGDYVSMIFVEHVARECPKEVRNPPKCIQKLFKRPLGAHLGPMFLKDMSWNAQLTAKMRPKVAP